MWNIPHYLGDAIRTWKKHEHVLKHFFHATTSRLVRYADYIAFVNEKCDGYMIIRK